MVINTCIILCEVLFVCLRIIYWHFFRCLCDFFRCVTSAKEWRKRTCPCTADVPETLNSRSQPRFLLSHTSFSLVKKATFNIFLTCYFSPLLSTELLRADRGVSEHRVSLQHELPGGDHRLVGCYEPTHQPERSLNVTSAPPALPPLHLRRPLLNLRKTLLLFDGVSSGSGWCGLEDLTAVLDCRYICFDDVIMKLCTCEFQILTVNKKVFHVF